MNDLLVATDLTAESENAFARAIQIAQASGARLHVLHVRAQPQVQESKDRLKEIEAEIAREVEACIRDCGGDAGLEHVLHIEHRGRVHDVITQTCRRVRAELAVIGRSARSGDVPGSVLLTSGRVLVNAQCPVLVVSQGVSGHYRHVLLEAGDIDAAGQLANRLLDFGPNIRLTILGIVGPADASSMTLFQRLRVSLRERRLAGLHESIARAMWARRLAPERLALETASGDPLDVLRERLAATQVDLVAVTGMRRRLLDDELGERTRQALTSTACDVLAY